MLTLWFVVSDPYLFYTGPGWLLLLCSLHLNKMAARSPWLWSPAGWARWPARSGGVGTRSSPSRTPAPTGTAAHAWTPSGDGDSGRAARCAGTTPSAPLRRDRAWRPPPPPPPPPAPGSVCPLTLKWRARREKLLNTLERSDWSRISLKAALHRVKKVLTNFYFFGKKQKKNNNPELIRNSFKRESIQENLNFLKSCPDKSWETLINATFFILVVRSK